MSQLPYSFQSDLLDYILGSLTHIKESIWLKIEISKLYNVHCISLLSLVGAMLHYMSNRYYDVHVLLGSNHRGSHVISFLNGKN